MGFSKEKTDYIIGLDHVCNPILDWIQNTPLGWFFHNFFCRIWVTLIQKMWIKLIPSEGWIQRGFHAQNVMTTLKMYQIILYLDHAVSFKISYLFIRFWFYLFIRQATVALAS